MHGPVERWIAQRIETRPRSLWEMARSWRADGQAISARQRRLPPHQPSSHSSRTFSFIDRLAAVAETAAKCHELRVCSPGCALTGADSVQCCLSRQRWLHSQLLAPLLHRSPSSGQLQSCRSWQTAIPRIAILPHAAAAARAVLPPPTGGGGRTGRGQLEEEGSGGGCKNCHSLFLFFLSLPRPVSLKEAVSARPDTRREREKRRQTTQQIQRL